MKQNSIIYPIGAKVKVLPDYKNQNNERDGIAKIVGHSINKSLDGDFIDNHLLFENGNEELFANWEIEVVDE